MPTSYDCNVFLFKNVSIKYARWSIIVVDLNRCLIRLMKVQIFSTIESYYEYYLYHGLRVITYKLEE